MTRKLWWLGPWAGARGLRPAHDDVQSVQYATKLMTLAKETSLSIRELRR